VKQSIVDKLQQLVSRSEELGGLLSDPDIIADQKRFRDLSREYAQLAPMVELMRAIELANADLEAAREMTSDDDPAIREMGTEELTQIQDTLDTLEVEVQKQLIPKDPHDEANIFLEIRAGTGGDEAAIFAGNLFRMYQKFAEQQNWQMEILSEREGDHGGFKEIISKIDGRGAYSRLKFESGAHRVQRVPETEAKGRIQTSLATVAVMPEPEDVEIDLKPDDYRRDTFSASGPGGQHVNKTSSAIRLTHHESGIVVSCQDEKSQHKNLAKALRVLKTRLYERRRQEEDQKRASERKILVGSGDRSQRIRTYNFPENRITDHRINFTLYKLDQVMAGNIGPVIEAMIDHQRQQRREAMGAVG
jgi:peptide chain release factor 1